MKWGILRMPKGEIIGHSDNLSKLAYDLSLSQGTSFFDKIKSNESLDVSAKMQVKDKQFIIQDIKIQSESIKGKGQIVNDVEHDNPSEINIVFDHINLDKLSDYKDNIETRVIAKKEPYSDNFMNEIDFVLSQGIYASLTLEVKKNHL